LKREEGLAPKPKLVEVYSFRSDPLSDEYLGCGFGLFFRTWIFHRRHWKIVGIYSKLNRPKWEKTIVEMYRILYIAGTVWDRQFSIYVRLWRIRVPTAS